MFYDDLHVLFGCSFYYGDMERKYLPKVEPQNGVRMHIFLLPPSLVPRLVPSYLVAKCVTDKLREA